MNNILRIDASMRNDGSHSRQLMTKLVQKVSNENSHITHRDLADGVPYINESWIKANFTDPSSRTPEQRSVLSYSDA